MACGKQEAILNSSPEWALILKMQIKNETDKRLFLGSLSLMESHFFFKTMLGKSL